MCSRESLDKGLGADFVSRTMALLGLRRTSSGLVLTRWRLMNESVLFYHVLAALMASGVKERHPQKPILFLDFEFFSFSKNVWQGMPETQTCESPRADDISPRIRARKTFTLVGQGPNYGEPYCGT